MTALQTIAVAFAMFSALPMPQFDWNEKNMRYALCAFPLVGVVCGALWCVCGVLPLPAAARAAGFCLVPVWVTGGIHLDGYADTCDALSSYGDTAKKLEILKDPHCGAFAVICVCLLTLAQWVMFFSAKKPALLPLAMLPVVTRGCAGLAVLSLRPMQSSQYAKARTKSVSARVVLYILLTAALALPFVIDGWRGLAGLAAAGVYWLAALSAKRQLGGMSGDVSGFALCLAEFAGAAILCLWR